MLEIANSHESEHLRIIVHEVSHYVVATHFKIPADPQYLKEAERYQEANGQIIAGECKLDVCRNTFQLAAIGWAGLLGEQIIGVTKPSILIGFPLTKSTLKDFYFVAVCNLDQLSSADQFMINGYKPSTWLPFKSAYRILRKNSRRLARLAAYKSPKKMNTETQGTNSNMSLNARANFLANVLKTLPLHHPDRENYVKILEFLRIGQEPPAGLFQRNINPPQQ